MDRSQQDYELLFILRLSNHMCKECFMNIATVLNTWKVQVNLETDLKESPAIFLPGINQHTSWCKVHAACSRFQLESKSWGRSLFLQPSLWIWVLSKLAAFRFGRHCTQVPDWEGWQLAWCTPSPSSMENWLSSVCHWTAKRLSTSCICTAGNSLKRRCLVSFGAAMEGISSWSLQGKQEDKRHAAQQRLSNCQNAACTICGQACKIE